MDDAVIAGTARRDLVIPQGADWAFSVWYRDRETGGAASLGLLTSARLQVRATAASDAVLLDASMTGGQIAVEADKIRVRVPASATAALAQGGVYDLLLGFSDGATLRALEGRAILSPRVTR